MHQKKTSNWIKLYVHLPHLHTQSIFLLFYRSLFYCAQNRNTSPDFFILLGTAIQPRIFMRLIFISLCVFRGRTHSQTRRKLIFFFSRFTKEETSIECELKFMNAFLIKKYFQLLYLCEIINFLYVKAKNSFPETCIKRQTSIRAIKKNVHTALNDLHQSMLAYNYRSAGE